MENRTCPVSAPDELRFLAIQKTAEKTMLEKTTRAISDAAAEVAKNMQEAGLELEPTSEGYFMFALQQVTFVRLCGGDPDSLRGGNPEIAEHIIRNCRNIVDTYWKVPIEETKTS